MIHKSNLIQNISEISPGMNIDFYIKEIYNKTAYSASKFTNKKVVHWFNEIG